MIYFRDVTKEYPNGTRALNGVNLHIAPQEFVFVVGASGAGKSTFLKLLLHEELPTAGSVRVGRFELNALKARQIPLFRRQLGVVFQDFRLIATMDVYDNIAFAMRVVGAKEKHIAERVHYLLHLVGLERKEHSKPSELSGGEQQRVAIARALANEPDLIIADEPTGNIDPRMSQELLELFVQLNEAGTTIVMVTHAHDLVRHYGRRVIILDNGSIAADGGLRPTVSPAPPRQSMPARAHRKPPQLPPEEVFSNIWKG
ncbi:MAG: cell division ATP-binding protein FtsE [Oscillospiraceae bacterium]|jgi:cell division transport system ATP-binding protein|nr:cell division ATP-binding protein FtsE [Oscillospiraceae bacterium]